MTRRFSLAAIPILVCALVLAVGPAWQEKKAALTCDDGSQRAVYADMDACSEAMDDGCRQCAVQQQWYAPFVFFLLVPALILTAIAVWGGPIAQGASAVWLVFAVVFVIPWSLAVYSPGERIPWFIYALAVSGPHLVFFPVTWFPSDGGTPGAPSSSALVGTLVFWLVASVVFGVVTARRVRRRVLVLPLAIVFVVAIAVVTRFALPLLGHIDF